MNSREFIVLHHTANPKQEPQFDSVNAYHKSRKFPKSSLGFYVGYHYFIGFEGTIKVARAEWETGAHCDARLMNIRGIGIGLAGNFTKVAPNEAQIQALTILVKDIARRNDIPNERILNHRDCKATACPGMDLVKVVLERLEKAKIDSLKTKLENYKTMYAIATNPMKQRSIGRGIKRLAKLFNSF